MMFPLRWSARRIHLFTFRRTIWYNPITWIHLQNYLHIIKRGLRCRRLWGRKSLSFSWPRYNYSIEASNQIFFRTCRTMFRLFTNQIPLLLPTNGKDMRYRYTKLSEVIKIQTMFSRPTTLSICIHRRFHHNPCRVSRQINCKQHSKHNERFQKRYDGRVWFEVLWTDKVFHSMDYYSVTLRDVRVSNRIFRASFPLIWYVRLKPIQKSISNCSWSFPLPSSQKWT